MKIVEAKCVSLGDVVEFTPSIGHEPIMGVVQDVSEFPEIWIEVGVAGSDTYKRYKTTTSKVTDNRTNDRWYERRVFDDGGTEL